MSLTSHRTTYITSVFIIHIVPPGTGGVQTMNHVTRVNVRKSLGRQDLDVDAGRATEMIFQVTLSSFPHMNIGNFMRSSI